MPLESEAKDEAPINVQTSVAAAGEAKPHAQVESKSHLIRKPSSKSRAITPSPIPLPKPKPQPIPKHKPERQPKPKPKPKPSSKPMPRAKVRPLQSSKGPILKPESKPKLECKRKTKCKPNERFPKNPKINQKLLKQSKNDLKQSNISPEPSNGVFAHVPDFIFFPYLLIVLSTV